MQRQIFQMNNAVGEILMTLADRVADRRLLWNAAVEEYNV